VKRAACGLFLCPPGRPAGRSEGKSGAGAGSAGVFQKLMAESDWATDGLSFFLTGWFKINGLTPFARL
jgi:hypothetical protein